jgi:lysozyme family protein
MDHVFVSEGGYAERDSEPGGAVNMGISFRAFEEWWDDTGRDLALERRPQWSDLKRLSRDEAEEIYRHYYFDPLRFGQLPAGVDYAFVDFAINSGVGGAIRAVQRLMRFPVTGKIDTNDRDGPFFWALRSRDPQRVIDDICEARLLLMMSSRKWPRFAGNWSRRLKLVKERAYAMAGITAKASIDFAGIEEGLR